MSRLRGVNRPPVSRYRSVTRLLSSCGLRVPGRVRGWGLCIVFMAILLSDHRLLPVGWEWSHEQPLGYVPSLTLEQAAAVTLLGQLGGQAVSRSSLLKTRSRYVYRCIR